MAPQLKENSIVKQDEKRLSICLTQQLQWFNLAFQNPHEELLLLKSNSSSKSSSSSNLLISSSSSLSPISTSSAATSSRDPSFSAPSSPVTPTSSRERSSSNLSRRKSMEFVSKRVALIDEQPVLLKSSSSTEYQQQQQQTQQQQQQQKRSSQVFGNARELELHVRQSIHMDVDALETQKEENEHDDFENDHDQYDQENQHHEIDHQEEEKKNDTNNDNNNNEDIRKVEEKEGFSNDVNHSSQPQPQDQQPQPQDQQHQHPSQPQPQPQPQDQQHQHQDQQHHTNGKEKVIHEGLLSSERVSQKSSGSGKKSGGKDNQLWKTRKWRLTEDQLGFLTERKKGLLRYLPWSKPEFIPVLEISEICEINYDKKTFLLDEHCFSVAFFNPEIGKRKVLYLKADNRDEMVQWVLALARLRSPPTTSLQSSSE